MTLSGLTNGLYTVRLVFAEPDRVMSPEKRRFDVRVQDRPLCENFSVLADAGGAMRAVTKAITKVAVNEGNLTVLLSARQGETLLSGLEIIREGLPVGPMPSPARVPGKL